MEDKTLDYYLGLPLYVKARFNGEGCEVWIEELPHCRASVRKDESVEKLFRLLEKEKRRWIEQMLSRGEEIPEPPKRDPFWEEFDKEGELEEWQVREMLYERGSSEFPLRVLETSLFAISARGK